MIKVYFAARFSKASDLRRCRSELEAIGGFKVNSRWLDEPPELDEAIAAEQDLADVTAADVVINFTSEPRCGSRGARHTEFGIGLARGARLILCGPHREHVFHHLPQVEAYPDWLSCLSALRAEPVQALASAPTEMLVSIHLAPHVFAALDEFASLRGMTASSYLTMILSTWPHHAQK